MSDARERIRQKILADIKKRVDTYWLESQKNDAGFSDTAKAAKEEIHKWAAIDLNFLHKEYEKQHVENTRLRAELEAAKEMIGRACVWLDLHRKDGIDDVLRALSGFLSATENGGR